jgi:hypothetical protein
MVLVLCFKFGEGVGDKRGGFADGGREDGVKISASRSESDDARVVAQNADDGMIERLPSCGGVGELLFNTVPEGN